MDEDYDEIMGPMGPRPGQDMRKVFKEDPSALPSSQEPVKRSSAGPPPTLFHSMPDRWAQHEDDELMNRSASSSRRSSDIMSFDEEEEDDPHVPSNDSRGIRQEALRMLEVADSGTYSVHRTVTGGFMAEPRSMGKNKRVPAALAGLGSFANPAARSSKPRFPTASPTSVYRDDPPLEEDYEYSDDRFATNQVQEEKKESSWSSRYSVDETLLNMSGGAVHTPPAKKGNRSFLDKLDMQNSRRSARNMFATSPAKESKVFGSGFSFRQKNVFGKQGVAVASPSTDNSSNLRTVWMDAGSPSNSPARSWMDDLRDKRNKRRNCMIVAALVCAFLVTLAALLGARNKSGDVASSTSKTGSNDEEAVTFYITSDSPLDSDEEKTLANQLTKLSKRADFLVHLGNIQDSDVTQCASDQYEKVSNILLESPVPVYIVPGEEDWPNCPDQDQGWYNWVDNFGLFDTNFDKVRTRKTVCALPCM